MFVADNGDVYVAGFEYRSEYGGIIKVWKNDTLLYNLTDGSLATYGLGLFVAPGDVVYVVAGVEDPTGINYRGRLWRNGQDQSQSYQSNGRSSVFHDVCVDNGDVYVSGYETETFNHAASGNSISRAVAKIWKNGNVLYRLRDTSFDSCDNYAFSISVSGGNVYATGWETNWNYIYNSSSRQWEWEYQGRVAKLWRNGVSQNLGLAGTGESSAANVHASGGDVCVALWEVNSSNVGIAKYWKNGVLTNLGNGSLRTQALGIYGHGGNVYVVGGETDPQKGFQVAKYWRNGEAHTISSGNYAATAWRIVVK